MKKLMLLAICSGIAFSGFGWGQKGHDATVAIAGRHLTEATRAAVDSLLGGKSLVYYANWLDNASHTPQYEYSKTWHYRNIDADETFENAVLLSTGDIIRALPAQAVVLADKYSSAAQKELALKMVIHLTGDIHQPMHLGHASDRGGNQWKVKYFDRETNLHSYWDSTLPEAAHKWSYTEWADQLDRLPEAEMQAIAAGNASDWARESYDICTEIYDSTPKGSTLSYDYIAKWTPVVEDRFLKGGIRLADLLNSIFDPDYKGSNTVLGE